MENKKYKIASDAEISIKELLITLKDWWQFLYSKKIIIILFCLIGGSFGFLYAKLNKPIYVATTTFVLEDESGKGGLGSLAGLASIAGVDIGNGGGIFQGDNILSLYKSRTMLEESLLTTVKVGDKHELLLNRYIAFNHLKKEWEKNQELAKLKLDYANLFTIDSAKTPERLRDSILGDIVNNISKNYLVVTKPDKKLSTIQVDVRCKDDFFAKAFNDALVKNVNQFYIDTKTKKTLTNVKILQHKTDSVRGVMNGAIYTAAAVNDATPNLNPTRQTQRVAPIQRAQFSAETNKSILNEMVKNLEMTKMALLKETPLIQVLDRPILPLKIEKIGVIRGSLIGSMISLLLIILILTLRRFITIILK